VEAGRAERVRHPQALTPTGTNLLGLVKHAATFELEYFGAVFGRPHGMPLPSLSDSEPNADMWATPDRGMTRPAAYRQGPRRRRR
jgi:hypothetical protein